MSERPGVGMGKVAQPIRVAVTGNTVSPGIGETLLLLGKEEALAAWTRRWLAATAEARGGRGHRRAGPILPPR